MSCINCLRKNKSKSSLLIIHNEDITKKNFLTITRENSFFFKMHYDINDSSQYSLEDNTLKKQEISIIKENSSFICNCISNSKLLCDFLDNQSKKRMKKCNRKKKEKVKFTRIPITTIPITTISSFPKVNKKKRPSVSKDKIKVIKTICEHSGSVTFLLNLKDGRIASGACDSLIKIYDPKNDYKCDMTLEGHLLSISSLCQLEDENIASSSYQEIKIWKINNNSYECVFTIKEAHKEMVSIIICLPNNRIASIGYDDSLIKIWKSDPTYNENPLQELQGERIGISSIIYLSDRNILVSASTYGTIRLWDVSTYQCITIINRRCSGDMYQIDRDRIIIGGFKCFALFNISNFKIENIIKDEKLLNVRGFLKLRDDNTILCGCSIGRYCIYNIKTQQYEIIGSEHKQDINYIIKIDDSTFVTCSYDHTIKISKY